MKKKLLNKGDVIKTHPRKGFWGCAVVISQREKTEDRDPMCHIAITSVVFQHDYEFSELDTSKLDVLVFDREYRLKPNEVFTKREILIGVYSRKVDDSVKIIGNIDTSRIHDGPLPFEPWYDLEVTYPLCGKVDASFLGGEAVTTWRRTRDREAVENEILAADKEHWDLIARMKREGNKL